MAKLTINNGLLQAAIEQQLKRAALRYTTINTQVITENRQWEGFGERDIVDTGQLRASQRLDRVNATTYRLFYTAAYALWVHEGYTLRNGTSVAARPWTLVAKEILLREIGQR